MTYMTNIKFYLVTGLFIIGAGILGYAAINSLRDPVYYANNQEVITAQLGDETIGELTSASQNNLTETGGQLTASTSGTKPTSGTVATSSVDSTTSSTQSTTTASRNTDLIARLKKIPSGTVLKTGSSGDSVKAIQEALNIVAKAGLPTTGTGVGNFGPATETAVKNFQKANSIPQTGQVASQTLAKLIEKLQ